MTDHDVVVTSPSDDGEERLDRSLAEQLVEQARADGVDLVGPGGLLSDVTKQVLETGLEVEMEEHLGYPKHAAEGRNGGNSRNGTRSKTVITEVGPVEIDAPRDRDGTFEAARCSTSTSVTPIALSTTPWILSTSSTSTS